MQAKPAMVFYLDCFFDPSSYFRSLPVRATSTSGTRQVHFRYSLRPLPVHITLSVWQASLSSVVAASSILARHKLNRRPIVVTAGMCGLRQ
jgi:hypothetical protein